MAEGPPPSSGPPPASFVERQRAKAAKLLLGSKTGNGVDEEEEKPPEEGAEADAKEEKGPRMPLCQFVLFKHTVLSLCFRKSGKNKAAGIKLEDFGVRERVFVFFFVTSSALYVAISTQISLSQTDGSTLASMYVTLSTILFTLFVVLPLTMIVKCKLTAFSSWVRERLTGCAQVVTYCVPSLEKYTACAGCDVPRPAVREAPDNTFIPYKLGTDSFNCPAPRLEELALAGWCGYVFTMPFLEHVGVDALTTGLGTLATTYVSEFPALIVQYLTQYCCCQSCLPAEDEFAILPDAAETEDESKV